MSRLVIAIVLAVGLTGCSVMPPESFPRAERVDLDRFVGTWYVIAHIPPWTTADAYNSIEYYERAGPDVVDTRFTYRDGGFDGERERMDLTGYVLADTGNAVWAMQPFWPLRLEYTVSYVGPEYDTTIIARSDRDYVWIMARTPSIDSATYDDLAQRVDRLGYDTSALRRVPQQPLDERDDHP